MYYIYSQYPFTCVKNNRNSHLLALYMIAYVIECIMSIHATEFEKKVKQGL